MRNELNDDEAMLVATVRAMSTGPEANRPWSSMPIATRSVDRAEKHRHLRPGDRRTVRRVLYVPESPRSWHAAG